MIMATVMLLYSSVVLAFLFGFADFAIKAQQADASTELRLFLIFFRDLPFTLVFISH